MKRKFPVLIAVLIILLLSDVVVSALILREYNRNVSLISLISAAALVILFLSVVIYKLSSRPKPSIPLNIKQGQI